MKIEISRFFVPDFTPKTPQNISLRSKRKEKQVENPYEVKVKKSNSLCEVGESN